MNIDPTILKTLFASSTVALIKLALLILLLIYIIFIFMLTTKIRSLNKTVFLPPESGEGLLRIFAILYLLAALSLFVATLVIV